LVHEQPLSLGEYSVKEISMGYFVTGGLSGSIGSGVFFARGKNPCQNEQNCG